MNFADLIPVAYENAKAKGFWDRERPISEFVGLIISELGEAWEEFRSGSREGYVDENGKPQGLPSELADAVIFLADMCGGYKVSLEFELNMEVSRQEWFPFPDAFCRTCSAACEIFFSRNSGSRPQSPVHDFLVLLNDLARVSGVDLAAAIEQKMAYNATRSKRHGGKRL